MSRGQSDSRSDAELVSALNAGDRSAFDSLYFRHRDWVVRLARRFTGSDDDALDVLQDTFAYFFRKFPGFVLTARLTTFFYPVVKNISIALRDKRKRHRDESAIVDPPAVLPPADDPRAELAIVLQDLPQAQREVLLLRFVDGLSLSEIAEALEIPEGTVKSRLHVAIQSLKADPRIAAYFEEE